MGGAGGGGSGEGGRGGRVAEGGGGDGVVEEGATRWEVNDAQDARKGDGDARPAVACSRGCRIVDERGVVELEKEGRKGQFGSEGERRERKTYSNSILDLIWFNPEYERVLAGRNASDAAKDEKGGKGRKRTVRTRATGRTGDEKQKSENARAQRGIQLIRPPIALTPAIKPPPRPLRLALSRFVLPLESTREDAVVSVLFEPYRRLKGKRVGDGFGGQERRAKEGEKEGKERTNGIAKEGDGSACSRQGCQHTTTNEGKEVGAPSNGTLTSHLNPLELAGIVPLEALFPPQLVNVPSCQSVALNSPESPE